MFYSPNSTLFLIRPAFGSDTKYSIVEFTDPEHAKTAVLLTGTPLLHKPIQISVTAASIPNSLTTSSGDPSSPPTNGPSGAPTSPTAALAPQTLIPAVGIINISVGNFFYKKIREENLI